MASTFQFTLPLNDNQYRRAFEAEIDVLSADELAVRGQMQDRRLTLRHRWKIRTPDYEVIEAEAQQLAGNEKEFSPELCKRYEAIKGVRIGRGFSKRILTELGGLPGTQEHLLLAIEMARVGQQVYQFPPEFEKQFQADKNSTPAKIAWEKDRVYMPDLKNSCFTYRDETVTLFENREVKCSFDTTLTRPQPGDRRVFWRRKQITITADEAGNFLCENSMEDRIHDIRVKFLLTREGQIRNAESEGKRLPYYGICEDPHRRTPKLNGLQLTSDFLKQFAEYIGGAQGCTHLFDLSIDCLRLFKFGE